MFAFVHILLVGGLAYFLQARLTLLASFRGLPRYLCAYGLALFLVNWGDFLLFTVVGGGPIYWWGSWVIVLAPLFYFSDVWRLQHEGFSTWRIRLPTVAWPPIRQWNFWVLFLAAFVLVRFYTGIDTDDEGNVWSTFNFVDTAFHLSVANAFLVSPGFPPLDLDVAPYPLKYHFLADFHVAHLARLGLQPLTAMWWMNLVSAAVMVGALWATFQSWLKLSARWVMLAALVFLFMNTELLNLIQYFVFHPAYFHPENPFYGLLRYPFFNFEAAQPNCIEPQRALLFSLPIALLILHAAYGEKTADQRTHRRHLLQAFMLVCLLPLAHIVGFAVMAVALVPALWPQRRWFCSRALAWAPFLALGLLQLAYLQFYGPPTNTHFSSWTFAQAPMRELPFVPVYARWVVFWFLTNGDFFFWGLLFGLLAWTRRRQDDPALNSSLALWEFLRTWRGYLVACALFFLLINVYRYSFEWADSNKFVLFFNLGLSLVIVLGAAQWNGRRQRWLSHALWTFFFLLSTVPQGYAFYSAVLGPEPNDGKTLLFDRNAVRAANWARAALPPQERILTAAYRGLHFVTALAARPTLAGIYSESDPYRQDDRAIKIRDVYEHGSLGAAAAMDVRYVCISRIERRSYKIDPYWYGLMKTGRGVAFFSGDGPGDNYSVYIFDLQRTPRK